METKKLFDGEYEVTSEGEVFSLKNIISNEQKQYGCSHQTKRSNPFFTYNNVLLLTVVPG